jgi:AmiR/NasT family two-component response regulator
MPMRLRSNVIGALALLSTSTTDLGPEDLAVAQALADVATISVLQHRALQDAHVLADQLTQALSSRVVIEQAKGLLCERLQTTMDDAFNRLRRHARATNQVLSEVARKVTTSELDPDELTERPGA